MESRMREGRRREAKARVHLQRKDTAYVPTEKNKQVVVVLQINSTIWIQEVMLPCS